MHKIGGKQDQDWKGLKLELTTANASTKRESIEAPAASFARNCSVLDLSSSSLKFSYCS